MGGGKGKRNSEEERQGPACLFRLTWERGVGGACLLKETFHQQTDYVVTVVESSHRTLGWPEYWLSASCQLTGASIMPES